MKSDPSDHPIIDDSKPPKQSLIERLQLLILALFQSLTLLTIVTVFISTFLLFVIADHIYQSVPALLSNSYQTVATELATQAGSSPSSTQILKDINHYNLAWYYITNAKGGLDSATKPYAPDWKNVAEKKSRPIRWQGHRYFEAVAKTDNGRYLHIGFATTPLLPELTDQESFLFLPMRAGYALILGFGTLCILLIMLKGMVSQPLKRLAQACTSLLLSRDAYSGVTKGGLNVPFLTAFEVKRIATGLKEVRRQYDGQFIARLQKEEELKQQQKSHEVTQDKISQEYARKFADTQHSLAELHTKELEEELISSIGQDIGRLRSRHQACQVVLDRLNDKYPTSIVHAAFFSLNDGKLAVETFIGFDDRTLKCLKEINHAPLAQELFKEGNYLHLGFDRLNEWGLQDIAQQLILKSALYFPLSFQGRNLGILGVYFNIEGQSVQDRIRVLRKVSEITSRHLYQNAIYVEELEAARTDPLTGLRNKKYFHEIIPQIFERASIDPNKSPFSFLLIDGDNFKKVNDTFGHQVGDEVLQELATTIKQYVRNSAEGSRPRDNVIRFGGEEFLIVLEESGIQNSEQISERIRKAVEEKQQWPGGLAHWTVSIGIATFPIDGTDVEVLLLQADKALYYIKNELGRNKICHASKVPKTFKWAKTYAKIAGELGVFEPATLLQALANAQKTGVLTIESSKERQCWMLFKSGQALQARVANLKGANAITELLTTFEEGSFKFQEQKPGDLTALPNLDQSFNINRNLDRCLLDAALAKDKFDSVQPIISSDTALLSLVPKEEFSTRWQILKELPDPPTKDELELMLEISKHINGDTSLDGILKSMSNTPTAFLWYAAAVLVQHGLAQIRANN